MIKPGPEMRRILALPRRTVRRVADADLSDTLRSWAPHLKEAQVIALHELEISQNPRGIFGDIGVGAGKFLVAMLAGKLLGLRRSLIITDSQLITQARREIDKFRDRFEAAGWEPMLLSYEALSGTDAVHILDKLDPQIVSCDEAHRLCHRESARTQRVLTFASQHEEVRWNILSGSLQRRHLCEIDHLAELALRDGSWLPQTDAAFSEWEMVLDRGAQPSTEQVAKLSPLMTWAGKETPQEAYRERYLSTPGVVSIHDTGPGMSLRVGKICSSLTGTIEQAFDDLTATWTLPDGTELVDSIEFRRHSQTLSIGFYYSVTYPDTPAEILDAWKEARRGWQRELRQQLHYRRYLDLDTVARVERAAIAGYGVPTSVIEAHRAWVAVQETVTPTHKTVWIDTAPVEQAVRLLKRTTSGLLWFYNSTALRPVLEDLGVPVFAGGDPAPSADLPYAACSVRSHGTGKNLQTWSNQIILEAPSSAGAWEQLLGRTHRHGQEADAVTAQILCTTWFNHAQFFSAHKEALEIEEKFGTKQRLVYSDKLADEQA